MKREKFSIKRVKEVLFMTGGMLRPTAKILKCHVDTVRNYIRRYPELEDAKNEANEELYDEVENIIVDEIRKRNTTMIIFFAKTRMKHRGYIEKDNNNITINNTTFDVEIPNDVIDKLTYVPDTNELTNFKLIEESTNGNAE